MQRRSEHTSKTKMGESERSVHAAVPVLYSSKEIQTAPRAPCHVATFLLRKHPPLTHLTRILRHDDDGAGIQVSFLLSVLKLALNRRFIQLGAHFPVDAFSNLRHNTIAKSSSKQVT